MNEIDQKINQEQIRLIYNQSPAQVVGPAFCAVIVTVFLWRESPQGGLIYWLAAIGVSIALRIWSVALYARSDSSIRQHRAWGPIYRIGAFATGVVWGAWPIFFYNHYSAEYLVLMSAVFAGIVAVNAITGNLYKHSFALFSFPVVLPFSFMHLLSGNETLVLTGVLLWVFLAVNLFLAGNGHWQYRKLISSKFENEELMDRLEQEKQIAERAVVAKSRFLAAASHDLRQPLHAMGLFLSALGNREHDPRKLAIIEDMGKSTEALNGLFNSLLDVSRLDAEIIEFNPAHLPAASMFDALRAQFQQQASEKNIELQILAGNHVFFSDGILLERVLRNLFSNAVQYTASGIISLSCEDHYNGSKLITLRDTGIGIPAESTEDVFSEYYQLNNPARDRNKGLGLGLSIVRRLCDLMDLRLDMDSEEGRGTVFTVVVPGGDPSQIVPQSKPLATKSAEGRVVLVVDDEPQVLQSMRHMLEGWGCEVMLAESARDALKVIALSEETPEVILSDYRLRDNHNGVDAVAAIRESVDKQIPAIIITGDTSPERLKEVKKTGLQLMHKPVNPDELHETMQRLFDVADIELGLLDSQIEQFKSAANH
ncbi:MAG: ATP-binding protein [Granulosicoccus sp.]